MDLYGVSIGYRKSCSILLKFMKSRWCFRTDLKSRYIKIIKAKERGYVSDWERSSGYQRPRTAIFENGAVAMDGTAIKKVGTLEEIKKEFP